jgi:hypothetical protein
MKRTLQFLSTFVFAILLALCVGVGVRKVRAQQRPVKAFQITTRVTQREKGVVTSDHQYYLARRSDGARMWQPEKLHQLELPSRGIVVEWSDGLNEISTTGLGRAYRAVDNTNCQGNSTLPKDTRNILGLPAQHFHNEDSLGGGAKVVFDGWTSLDVDRHALLSDTSYYDKSGALIRTVHEEAITALIGDPPESVFTIPEEKEVPLSKLHSDIAALQGTTLSPKAIGVMDKRYAYDKSVRDGIVPYPKPTGYSRVIDLATGKTIAEHR